MNIKQKIARKIKRLFDPIVQDHGAIMFGHYKGRVVRLCPVLSPGESTTIGEWVPDPIDLAVIERAEGRQK